MEDNAGYTVLVVEDDPTHQLLVRRALLNADGAFTIAQIARTSAEAERYVHQMTFDCLLVDNRIPGKRGLDLISSLREEGIDTPAVLMTNAGNEDLAVQAYNTHCAAYVVKDTDFWRRLPSVVADVITRDRTERDRHATGLHLEHVNARLDALNTQVQLENEDLKITQQHLQGLLLATTQALAPPLASLEEGLAKGKAAAAVKQAISPLLALHGQLQRLADSGAIAGAAVQDVAAHVDALLPAPDATEKPTRARKVKKASGAPKKAKARSRRKTAS